MKALLFVGAAAFGWAFPAAGQTMSHDHHGDMPMAAPSSPASPAAAAPDSDNAKAAGQDAAMSPHGGQHSGHDMHMSPIGDPHAGHHSPPAPQADPHAGHPMPAGSRPEAAAGTDLAAGDAPAPTPQPGLAASRFWGAEAMMTASHHLRHHHGGMTFRQVMLNLAEVQLRRGKDGYRWDGEAWIGGDIHRLTLKSEGEGTFGGRTETAEVQALYSRAIDPYWNLQAGVRHDIRPGPSRTYATMGIEGLAPYWFQVEGAVFLSSKGDVLARAEAFYDQRLTQNLVLQPRAEANFAAQTVRETGIGAGLSDLELGIRLRYERRREFAPYIGVSWERRLGETARIARTRGEGTGGFSFVAGVRTWF